MPFGCCKRFSQSLTILSCAALSCVAGLRADAQVQIAATQPSAEYVAMGSSLAAGPGVGTRDPDSPPLCMRSLSNYPHLFAAQRGLTLRDVTCSGATTAGILTGQRFLPPQIDAVGRETRLVTVTIGGNDVHLAENLFGWSCANAPEKIPLVWRPWICKVTPRPQIEDAFSHLEEHLRSIVLAVHERAPQARVIFVDYLQLVPARGSCPQRLPLTEEELAQSRADAARLAATTAKVARETGAGLVQASVFSRGHDVCAADPWVFPLEFPSRLLEFAPLAFHPNGEAMQAIAGALAKVVLAR